MTPDQGSVARAHVRVAARTSARPSTSDAFRTVYTFRMSIRRGLQVRARAGHERTQRRLVAARLKRSRHEIHPTARIAPGVAFRVPKATVGARTGIGGGTVFKGAGNVAIGAYSSLSERVVVITSDHRVDRANVLLSLHSDLGWSPAVGNVADVMVGSAVFVGDRVSLLPGVGVGHGAVCATGSVLTRNVPPFAIVAGVPARTLRMRFPPAVIDVLLEIAWWNWPWERIVRNQEFFEADLTTFDAASVRALVRR